MSLCSVNASDELWLCCAACYFLSVSICVLFVPINQLCSLPPSQLLLFTPFKPQSTVSVWSIYPSYRPSSPDLPCAVTVSVTFHLHSKLTESQDVNSVCANTASVLQQAPSTLTSRRHSSWPLATSAAAGQTVSSGLSVCLLNCSDCCPLTLPYPTLPYPNMSHLPDTMCDMYSIPLTFSHVNGWTEKSGFDSKHGRVFSLLTSKVCSGYSAYRSCSPWGKSDEEWSCSCNAI